MINNLAIATVMGIRTDRFLHINVDMPMFISTTLPKIKFDRLET